MQTNSHPAALAGLRVLELGGAAGEYCGKLFADMGAEVIKVEPPGGSPTRESLPFLEDQPGPDRSLPFLYLNTNKKSIVLDLARETDRGQLLELATTCDIVLESFQPGKLPDWGIGYNELAQHNPALVLTSITGFGQTGPHRDYRCTDLVASAMGGAMIAIGDPDDPPVTLAGNQAYVMASTNAAASSLIALRDARETGVGQHVDISIQETMLAVTSIAGVGKWLEDGIVPKRFGAALFASVPSGTYPCRDGKAYLMINRPAHWKKLAAWINEVTGNQEVLDPMFQGPSSMRQPYRDLLDLFISELSQRFDVADFYSESQARHLAVTPLNTAQGAIDDPQLTTRGFFLEVVQADEHIVRYPGAPYRLSQTPWALRRHAPLCGEHGPEILGSLSKPFPKPKAQPRASTANRPPQQALAGLRVVEFSAGMAGPWIGRFMATCGAEVIKVESTAHPDVTRLYIPPHSPELGIQSQLSPWFTDWNAGKRFVALDLSNPEGVSLAKNLIATCDVLIENYSNGVMAKLGLDYQKYLRSENPQLIYFNTTGYGNSGPNSNYITWGPNIEALSGIAHISGFPHRDCTMTQFAYPDPLSALHGLFSILCALRHRQVTGEGQAINLSQFEATVAAIGQVFMDPLANGRPPSKLGNRSGYGAPQGCYPCSGEDRWCVISIEKQEQWERFCEVLGPKQSLCDPRFTTLSTRIENSDALDEVISSWTRTRDPYEVMHLLQEAGIPAGVVQNTEDQFTRDPHLAARGYFEHIPHEVMGEVIAPGIPLGLTKIPGHTPHTGRAVGQDNRAIFHELGLAPERIDELIACGVIEFDQPA